MSKEKIRKVDLSGLPRKCGVGKHSGKEVIDWRNSVGEKIECVYDDVKMDIIIIKYHKNKITIYNDVYGEYDIKIQNFSQCQLANYLKIKTSDFKYDIGYNVVNSKRDYTVVGREYIKNNKGFNDKFYICRCNKCSCDMIMVEEYKLKNEEFCPYCGKSPRIIKLGINTIYDTAPWMIKLGISEEDAKTHTRSQAVYINVVCPDCGKLLKRKISSIYTYKTINCSCSDKNSYISKYLDYMLKQLDVNFSREVKFKWCKFFNEYKDKEAYGLYDFVIDDIKLIIEADGEFHRNDNRMNGQTKEESEYIDDIKDKLAEENGYEVIRISNEGNIKENILNSKLSKIFNLSNIDWIECDEFAMSNLVKKVCEYWNMKEEYECTKDLAKYFNLSSTTIRRYLNKGNERGWCTYEGRSEINRNRRKKK